MHPVDTLAAPDAAKPISMTPGGLRLPLTPADLVRWFSTAKPGDTIPYHRGHLAMDRAVGSRLDENGRKELNGVANTVMTMAEAGRAHLVQRRHGPGDYTYMVVAARPGSRRCVR